MTAHYFRFAATTFSHTFLDMLQRRRNQVIAVIISLPAFIPLLLIFLPTGVDFDNEIAFVFTQMAELLYIRAVTPLLALFFGAMLIGEDIESQTIPYILSRPVPRSAWIAGRFLAYLTATSLLMFAVLTISFVSCSILEISFPSIDTFLMLLRYEGVAVMSLMGYGAICMLLGSTVRRPIIVGILLIFLWQRFAMWAPGITDFFTIEKYVNALLPGGGTNIVSLFEATAIAAYKAELAVSAPAAVITLIGIAVACLARTTVAVLNKEYTTPTAVTE